WPRRAPGCARPRRRGGRFAWGKRLWSSGGFLRALGAYTEQMADREHEVGAVHGVEMEGVDAVLGELADLVRHHGRRHQLAGFGVVVEAFELLGEPVRHAGAGAGHEA